MTKYDFDIDYHSKALRKAELTTVAIREYLASRIRDMSLEEIMIMADALNDCNASKRGQTERLEEYRALQAEALNATSITETDAERPEVADVDEAMSAA